LEKSKKQGDTMEEILQFIQDTIAKELINWKQFNSKQTEDWFVKQIYNLSLEGDLDLDRNLSEADVTFLLMELVEELWEACEQNKCLPSY
jgi:hypothetical protein